MDHRAIANEGQRVKRAGLGIWKLLPVSALALVAMGANPQSDDSSIARGEAVYDYWCATCHSAGPGMPGTQALQVKYDGTLPALLVERTDLTPELIAFYVRNGVSVMPFFRKTEIGDSDLDALSRFIVSRAASP
jgi:mono/diheme cytochrome c family protein